MSRSKKLTVISAAVVVVAIFLFALRAMVPEDDWICIEGIWTKHGNPSSAMLQGPCQ